MATDSNGFERTENGRFTAGNKAAIGRSDPKVSTKVKQALVSFLELNIDKVQESFDQLKPLEKLQFVANILPYVVPKLSATQSENNTRLSGGINIRWSEPGVRHTGNKGSNGELRSLQNGQEDHSEPGRD
jgi:hypothetical protein